MPLEPDLSDIRIREHLALQIIALLEADSRVAEVRRGGSLWSASGGDQYSDIDIQAVLKPDVVDREFAEAVPELIAPVGETLIAGWGVRVLPGKYVRTLYFTDYPLFWHADVSAAGGIHVDGSDLLPEHLHPTRFYKTWLETLKGTLRGKADTEPDFIDTMLGRWMPLPPVDRTHSPQERLAHYLEECRRLTTIAYADLPILTREDSVRKLPNMAQRQKAEELHQRCAELLSLLAQKLL